MTTPASQLRAAAERVRELPQYADIAEPVARYLLAGAVAADERRHWADHGASYVSNELGLARAILGVRE